MKIKIIKVLIWLKVVKTTGEMYRDGTPITDGANKLHPLSYIIFIPICLVFGVIYFWKGIEEAWDSVF